MFDYMDYDEGETYEVVQKISRKSKSPKQKNYKKEYKNDFRKEGKFKREHLEVDEDE